MQYYVEKAVADRLMDSARGQRNAMFVGEWRALRRGLIATLVCRLTSRTPLRWCPPEPAEQRLPYCHATASYDTEGSSLW